MRIGIIAPEFPPDVGGMQSLAAGFAAGLAETDEVIVFARSGRDPSGDSDDYEVRRVLEDDFRRDRGALVAAECDIDIWFAQNAGLTPVAESLEAPCFMYVHGADFLNPWISYGSAFLEPIRRPYMAVVKKALRRRAMRAGAENLAHVFLNSRSTAALAKEHMGLANDAVTVVPPGVDDRFFQPHDAVGDRLELLTVARLNATNARKNIDGVIETVAMLRDDLPVTYTVIGDGDDRPRLEACAEQLGVADRVRFVGRVSEDELMAAYRRADLFVLAAKATAKDVEGFGIVYLEAAASGLPSICSRAGGSVDALHEGENGILIPDSEPATIAAAVRRFASERAHFTPERAQAVAERYRWSQTCLRLRSELVRRSEKA